MIDPIKRAERSLDGLSVGRIGELFFSSRPNTPHGMTSPKGSGAEPTIPTWRCRSWRCSSTLWPNRTDALALAFARRYMEQPNRGYAGGARRLLARVATGEDSAHGLAGTVRRGISETVPPCGSHPSEPFSREIPTARRKKQGCPRSLPISTTRVRQGQWRWRSLPHWRPSFHIRQDANSSGRLENTCRTACNCRERLMLAQDIPAGELSRAVQILGFGQPGVGSQDTVPFCVWNAAHHLDSFEEALWKPQRVGGIAIRPARSLEVVVSMRSADLPPAWLERREPLPPM